MASSPSSPPPAPGRLGRFAQAAWPRLRRFAAWSGNRLAAIGWGRFFLLAVLILAFGGLFTSFVESLESSFGDPPASPREKVRLEVRIDADGVQVQPGASAKERAGTPGRQASIRIDKDGVRIDSDAEAPKTPPAPPDPPSAPAAPKPPSVIGGVELPQDADPAKVREVIGEVVEEVRTELEEAANGQIDAAVRERLRRRGAPLSEAIMPMVLLFVFFLAIVKVLAGGKRQAEVRAQAATELAEGESLKRQLLEARLQTMQAQVEPHFLFNTLASVDYLIETDPQRASTMQKNLIQYLRAALPRMREAGTSLGREADLIRAYLEILQVRMEERLKVVFSVPQGLRSAEFPPMMLQSLVENAIKHGLEPKAEGGELRVAAEVVDGKLHVVVADTGLGFNPAGAPTAGTGLGLTNIRERLALLYGQDAQLSITANRPTGTMVTVELPYRTAAGGSTAAVADAAPPVAPV
jgi:hypothetical protein